MKPGYEVRRVEYVQEEDTYISAMLEGMGGRAGMTNRTGGEDS